MQELTTEEEVLLEMYRLQTSGRYGPLVYSGETDTFTVGEYIVSRHTYLSLTQKELIDTLEVSVSKNFITYTLTDLSKFIVKRGLQLERPEIISTICPVDGETLRISVPDLSRLQTCPHYQSVNKCLNSKGKSLWFFYLNSRDGLMQIVARQLGNNNIEEK